MSTTWYWPPTRASCSSAASRRRRAPPASARPSWPSPSPEQSGSGLHIHLSLLDRDGRNLFGEAPDGERHLGHAVRGLQDLMAESMLVFAPERQQLPPAAPPHLRADRADLGLEQPHRGPAHPARRSGRAAHRAPGRGLRRQPLSRARRRAGRRAGRGSGSAASPGRRWSATPMPSRPESCRSPGRRPSPRSATAKQSAPLVRRAVLQTVRRRPPGRARPVPRPDHAHRVRVVSDDGVTESPCAPFSVGTFLTSTRTHSRNALTSGRSAVARGDTK